MDQDVPAEQLQLHSTMVSFRDLRICTANFSKQFNKLGSGANSTVYKGVLYGLRVAVKVFDNLSDVSDERECEWEC